MKNTNSWVYYWLQALLLVKPLAMKCRCWPVKRLQFKICFQLFFLNFSTFYFFGYIITTKILLALKLHILYDNYWYRRRQGGHHPKRLQNVKLNANWEASLPWYKLNSICPLPKPQQCCSIETRMSFRATW